MHSRFSFNRAFSAVRNFSSKVSGEVKSSSLWVTYNRLLVEKPVATKAITSGVIAFVADIACQKAFKEEPKDGTKKSTDIDWKRTAKFTIINLVLVGPLLHFWYGTLVAKIPGTGYLSAIYRVALDQFVFAPFCIIPAFFSFSLCLDGTPELIPEKLKADWATTMVANFSLWVPAQFINFKMVPAQYQVLFANTVGLVWNVYLSAATNKALPSSLEDSSSSSNTSTKGSTTTTTTTSDETQSPSSRSAPSTSSSTSNPMISTGGNPSPITASVTTSAPTHTTPSDAIAHMPSKVHDVNTPTVDAPAVEPVVVDKERS